MAELTELLHRAYAPLAEMGFQFFASHQDEEVTASRCAIGDSYVAEQDGRLVGCITLRRPGVAAAAVRQYASGDSPWPELYLRDDVAVFGQFAVDPPLQGGGLGSKLLNQVEARARELGAAEIACDTAEGAKHLIDFYEKKGYRSTDKLQWSGVNYRSVILSKSLDKENG